MSAVIQNEYTGNNSTTTYSFTFPYLKTSDIKASLDGVDTTAFTLPNATTLQFNTAPGSGVKIKIFRQTSVDDLTATFYAGSAIKSEDLNDNFTQNLYKTQEVGARFVSNLGGTMTGNLNMGEDTVIKFEGATDDAHETTLTVVDPTADRTITLPNVTGTVVTTGDTGTVSNAMIANSAVNTSKLDNNAVYTDKIKDGNVTTAKLAANAVTETKIADNAVTNAKIADNAVNTSKLDNNAVYTSKIKDGNVTTAKLASNAVTTAKIADGNVTTAKIAFENVTSDKIAANAITSPKIADNAIQTAFIADSQITTAKIVDANITTAKIADANITTAKIADDAVTMAKLASGTLPSDISVNTHNITNGTISTNDLGTGQVTAVKIADSAISTAKIAADAITNAKIADDQIDSEHYVDGSIDTAHIGNTQVTDAKLASNAVTTSKITDANVTTDKIANDAITIGKIGCEQTTISNSDLHLPTSGAVVDYVAAQIAPLGGLEVVATEVAFPNTQPASGVVISISDAGGVVFNGSGVSTTGRTVGGSTVTINGAPSSLYNETLVAGVGLMVSSTGSSQTYNYHKILGKEDDIKQLSDDINDFNARYRVGSSNPTSALDAGDLFFNTSTQKLLVYNSTNSAWEEAQSIGNFYISTFSESFDGSRTAFTVSNAPSNAQQLIISINGVIQKPNSGTGQPSEGFTLSGSTVTFSSAIPSGSDYFAVVLGSTVNIGTPSDGTVSTAKLANGAVTTAKIADDAVTAAKIANIDGNINVNDNVKIRFGTHADLDIYHDGSHSKISELGTGKLILETNGSEIQLNKGTTENMLKCFTDGAVELYYDNTKRFETTSGGTKVYGNLTFADDLNTIRLNDNYKIQLGTSQDLQLYHDGTDSYLQNNNGTLRINNDGTDLVISTDNNIHIRTNGTEEAVKAIANGAVELYYDNSKKFETTNLGAQITGELSLTTHLKLLDNQKVVCGNGEDLKLWHDGTDSFIQNITGYLKVLNHVFEVKNDSGNEVILRGSANAAVELYYNNNLRFYTNSDAVTMRGGGDHRCEGNFRPWQHNVSDLGTSSDKWDDVYATNGTIQTSDRNEKNTITTSDLGLSFVNKLKPVSYKFNNKTRTHYGLIAQDVETTLSDISKSTSGFAGFIKENIPDKLYLEDDDIPEGKKVGDVKTAAYTTYGLRYGEFISPLIKAVQELSAEVETLKTKVAALEAE